MRTRTLLLVAALSAAGLATSLAQTNVYSLNVVGYVNVPLPASTLANGFSIVCNPLSTGSNTLSQVIPTAPDGTTVYRYVGGDFDIAVIGEDPFTPGLMVWDKPDMLLAPGEAVWLKNPGAATNLTFVGEVLQGTTTNDVPAGFSLRGSKVPQALVLLDANTDPTNHGILDLNYPATVDETIIYFFRNGGYEICSYSTGDFTPTAWDVNPIPAVGEGFWARELGSSKQWVRSFTAQ